MSSKFKGRLVLRTPLITAGHKRKFLDKALHSEADAVIMDLEDGVPPALKSEARNLVKEYLQQPICEKRLVFARLNSMETGLTQEDITVVSHKNLDGFVITKVYTAGELVLLDKMLNSEELRLGLPQDHFSVIVILETPRSILNAEQIVFSANRIKGIIYGAEDLLSDMEGYHAVDCRSLQPSRSQALMAARAAGIMPIDTPYIQVGNDEGLREFIKPGLELGYEGMLLISPSQIPIVKEMFTPAEERVKEAYEMVEIARENEQAKQGVAIAGKHFLSPPTLKRAVNLIARHEAIKAFEKFAAGYLRN